ncbi:Tyrosinase [Apiospora kogelbergensis]|uniref:tyrosinase n=1 Tax=Apiospora kogelbergensis TaxID=1337665 RepID=A0AAW0R186_9PEZI
MALASFVVPTVAQGQAIPITGLSTGIDQITGERPARKNINDLQAARGPSCTDDTKPCLGTNGATRDLYILGLSDLQNKSESDPISYFQLAGIHGRPFIPWNGVENATVVTLAGFCPHGAFASQYENSSSASYKAAAESFRVPYWDWASDYRLPASVIDQRVTVNGPHGKVDIPNPLYSYRWQQFPLNSEAHYFPTDDGNKDCWYWNETKRLPNANGSDQYDAVNQSLADISSSLQDQVYRVFTSAKDYETMASTEDRSSSFESVHDQVHGVFGAVMQNLDYSAFDPLFWLHHANVDRLYAMWQAIHYNNTYQTQVRFAGLLYGTPDANVTADSPLKPFYRGDDPTSFHTGRTAAAMATFGYTYPEIDDWSLSQEETRKAVTAKVNQLYSNGANGVSSAQQQRRRRRQQQAPRKEYFAHVSVERAELQLPCTVYFMLGDEKAGQMSLLSMPMKGRTHGEVPLTRALDRALASDAVAVKGNAPVGDVKLVTSKLRQLFRVEIRKADGTVIPVESVPSLSVEVEGEDVVAASHIGEFPAYGVATRLSGVGFGKLARREAKNRL